MINKKQGRINNIDEKFISSFRAIQARTYSTAKLNGFHETQGNALHVPTKLALIMSEASEALEWHRQGKDEEVGFELADIVIRTMDLAESIGIDLAHCVIEKTQVNERRPYKHGNKRY